MKESSNTASLIHSPDQSINNENITADSFSHSSLINILPNEKPRDAYLRYVEAYHNVPKDVTKPRILRLMDFLLNLPKNNPNTPYVYDLNDPFDVGLLKINKISKQNTKDSSEYKVWREKLRLKEQEIWSKYQSAGTKDFNKDLIIDLETDDCSLQLKRPSLSLLDSDDEDTGDYESRLVPFEHHNPGSQISNSDNVANLTLLNLSNVQVWKNTSKGDQYILHVPHFYNEWLQLDLSDKEMDRRICQANWLTDSLKEEMSEYFPTEDDVSSDVINHDNVMNKTPFETKCMSFFGFHRVFMNRVQIQQAVEYFCSKWNIKTHKNSACITCSYSKPMYQSLKK